MAFIAGVVQNLLGLLTAVRAVGPDPRIGIVGVDEVIKHPAVVHVRWRCLEATNKFMLSIDEDVILVAERVVVIFEMIE